MKKFLLLILIIIFSNTTNAQNWPQCDSLVIQCCTFDSIASNTLTIYVSNPSTELFDYPGFALFDLNMDTIAKETVVYFGISQGPQPHTLNIMSPLLLPFTGFLNPYTLFYDSLACSFPFYIADSTTSISKINAGNGVKIFPNPASNEVTIEMENLTEANNFTLSLTNVLGEKIYDMPCRHLPLALSLSKVNGGIYFIRINDAEKRVISIQKLVVGQKQR